MFEVGNRELEVVGAISNGKILGNMSVATAASSIKLKNVIVSYYAEN